MVRQQQKLNEFVAVGTLSLAVENLKMLDDEAAADMMKSDVKKIGGLEWRFELYKEQKEADGNGAAAKQHDQLNLRVFCNEKCQQDRLWVAKARHTVRCRVGKNNNIGTTIENNDFGRFYYFTSCCASRIPNVFNSAVKSGDKEKQLLIELDINVEWAMPALRPFDATLEIKLSDKTVKSLGVNKHSLASISGYFATLFFGENWRERMIDENDVYPIAVTEQNVEEFDIATFQFIIYSAMALGGAVHETKFFKTDYARAIRVLKLAALYDVPPLISYCEQILLNALLEDQQPKMPLLELADMYNLAKLKTHCLERISKADFMLDFSLSQQIYEQLSQATKKVLDERMARTEEGKEPKEKRCGSLAVEIEKCSDSITAQAIQQRHIDTSFEERLILLLELEAEKEAKLKRGLFVYSCLCTVIIVFVFFLVFCKFGFLLN